MSLSFVAAGSWASSGSTSTAAAPALPAGFATGDLLLLTVHWKQTGATLTTPTGWTLLRGPNAGGTGAAYGAGTGNTATSVFYRTATAGQTAPTIAALTGGSTTTASGNVMIACISAIRATSQLYQINAGDLDQNTSVTSWSMTASPDPTAVSGMILWASTAMSLSSTTVTVPVITATGAVIGSSTVTPTKGVSSTGADIGAHSFWASVTSGTNTAAPVVTETQSSATYGSGMLVSVMEATAKSSSDSGSAAESTVVIQLVSDTDYGFQGPTTGKTLSARTGFGRSTTDAAVGVSIVANGPINDVWVGLGRDGTPTDNAYIEIVSGSINGTVIATSNQVVGSTLTQLAAPIIQVTFAAIVDLTPGVTYYVRFQRTGASDSTNFFNYAPVSPGPPVFYVYDSSVLTWSADAGFAQPYVHFDESAKVVQPATASDSGGATESPSIAITSTVNDTATLSESPSPSIAITSTVNDTATLSESPSLAVASTDAGTVTEATAITQLKSYADTAIVGYGFHPATNFGGNSSFGRGANQHGAGVACGFSGGLIDGVFIYMAKFGTPTDSLVVSVGSSLNGPDLASATIAASALASPTTGNFVAFTAPVDVPAGTIYLRVVRTVDDVVNYYGPMIAEEGGTQLNYSSSTGLWTSTTTSTNIALRITEGASLTQQYAVTDAGSVTETPSLALSTTESGTGSDSPAIAVADSDSGVIAESAPVTRLSSTDSGWEGGGGRQVGINSGDAMSDSGISTTIIANGGVVDSVSLYLWKQGNPSDSLDVGIYSADGPGGAPNTPLAYYSSALSSSSLTGSPTWYRVNFTGARPALVAGTKYHVVLFRTGTLSATDTYVWGNADEPGERWSTPSGSWVKSFGTAVGRATFVGNAFSSLAAGYADADAGTASDTATFAATAADSGVATESAAITQLLRYKDAATVCYGAQLRVNGGGNGSLGQDSLFMGLGNASPFPGGLIDGVRIYVLKGGTPVDGLAVSVATSLNGPDVASATVAASALTGTFAGDFVAFATPVDVPAGTIYLRVVRTGAADLNNYYAPLVAEQRTGTVLTYNGTSGLWASSVSAIYALTVDEHGSLLAQLSGADSATVVESPLVSPSHADADAGSVTETQSIDTSGGSTPISSSDSGTLTESVTILLTATESVTAIDANSVAAATATTDSVTGTETNSTSSTVATADTAASAESILIALTTTDTAASTATASIAATIAQTDSGALNDGPSADLLAIPGSDPFTSTESGSLAQSTTDSATATNTASTSATVTTNDSATSTDSITLALSTADAGTRTESIAISVASSDSATITQSVSLALATTETGSTSDTVAIRLTTTDTSSAAEAAAAAATVTYTDQSSVTESPALALSISEQGTQADTAALSATLATSDTLAENDTVSLALSQADTGTVTDAAVAGVLITSTDAFIGTDSSLVTVLYADSATQSDTASIAATITTTDTATQSDSPAIALNTTDPSTGTDTQAVVNAFAGNDTGTATETASIAATVTGADTGTLNDGPPSGPIAATDVDSGTATQNEALSATVTANETSSVLETSTIAVTANEVLSTTETTTVSAQSTNLDTATATDNVQLATTTTDSATTTEATTISIAVTASDSCIATDTAVITAITVNATDSATQTDSQAIALTATENATGIETSSIALTTIDAATLSDSVAIKLSATDIASDSETMSVFASLTDTHTATGSDTGQLLASISISDNVIESETTALMVNFNQTDSATTFETIDLATLVQLADSAAITELMQLASADADTATLLDTGYIIQPDSITFFAAGAIVLGWAASNIKTDIAAGSAKVGWSGEPINLSWVPGNATVRWSDG